MRLHRGSLHVPNATSRYVVAYRRNPLTHQGAFVIYDRQTHMSAGRHSTSVEASQAMLAMMMAAPIAD